MLRIAICDDEKSVRDSVKKCLDNYSMQRDFDIVYREFSTGLDFLRDSSSYHILILDYQLSEDKQINGIAIAKKLRSYDEDIHIIFLTSFPKVVFSSFEVATFRFLIKPLDTDKLFRALDDYLKSTEKNNVSLTVRINGINTILNTKKILYLEGMSKYTLIHTNEDEIECHEVMADVEKRLPQDSFYRCHRSFVANFKYIKAYDSSQIYLMNEQTLPISKKKSDEFKSAYITYAKRHCYI